MKYIFVSGGRFTTFASIMNNHPKSPIIDLQQQQLLLRMEYEHEKEEFKRQTETMGVARKVKRGLCWYPASPDICMNRNFWIGLFGQVNGKALKEKEQLAKEILLPVFSE